MILPALGLGQVANLALSSATATPGSTVTLNVTLSGGSSPAALQWTLGYTSADISSVQVTTGAAAAAAGKAVSCGSGSGSLTCLAYGVNTTAIGDGVVAVVSMTIASNASFVTSAVTVTAPVAVSPGASSITAVATGGVITLQTSSSTPSAPAPVSVSPSSGSGTGQLFSLVYSDSNGYSDIRWVEAAIGSSLTPVGSCYIHYDRTNNSIYLANDTGSAWAAAVTMSGGGVIQNGQCAIDVSGSSASGSGNSFTLNLMIAFRAPFAGSKNVYMQAMDLGGLPAGWSAKGTWTVPSGNQAPTLLSVSPASGSGVSQLFTFRYFDPNGAADIQWTEGAIAATQTAVSSCYFHYDRAANLVYLSDDAGTGWVGSRAPGSAGFLQNSQCAIDTGGSFSTSAGSVLNVNLSVAFRTSYTGSKNVYSQALDLAANPAAWQQKASWTVPSGPQAPITFVPSPVSGGGSAQRFTFTYFDANGYSDIVWTEMAIHSTLTSVGACYLHYDRAGNTLYLANDTGSAWAASGTLGSTGTLQNGQCAIDLASSSASGSGGVFSINLMAGFRFFFAGSRNIYMQAMDSASLPAGWQYVGSWTVPSGNQGPAAMSVNPSSGQGWQQTYTFTYFDTNGYADIRWTEMAISSALTSVSSCYLHYERATNVLLLANDSGTAWAGSAPLGSPGFMSNGQCSVDLANSAASSLGAVLTVRLAVQYKDVYTGLKNVYMQALDTAGVPAGWQQMGTWNH